MFDATGATPLLSPFEFPVESIYGQDLAELYAATPIDPTFLMMATPASMISPASLVSPFLFGLELPAPASLSSTPIPTDCGLDADGLLSFNAPAQSPTPPPKSPGTPVSSVGSPALSTVESPSIADSQSKTDDAEDDEEDGDAESPRSPVAHKSAASRARGRANHPPEVEEVFVRWLLKHYRHPYPDKHEKQSLMEQTKTEDNQVMHWFDNARRRAVRTKDKKGKNAVWRFVPRWVEKRRRIFPQLAKEFDAVELLQ
ncbi:hypothetical protein BJ742DRAFT_235511 [Cladochytrium replicatum]|nr:hypothetical protein BJ742DRAFT_235511 [Cladochytrium replicatum]